MSHYHLEVIMPPTAAADIEGRLQQIMAPYDEQGEDSEGNPNLHTFWDWYVIGGRWSGNHLKSLVAPEALDRFTEELTRRNITVSGVQCGKQQLEPASQIPEVDQLWREFFPDSELKTCPLFNHFNNQYNDNPLDIDTFGEITSDLESFRVIVGGLDYQDDKYEAKFMLESETWNGCNFQETNFKGPVRAAIEDHHSKMEHYKEEYREKHTVRDDWLVITVDYHS